MKTLSLARSNVLNHARGVFIKKYRCLPNLSAGVVDKACFMVHINFPRPVFNLFRVGRNFPECVRTRSCNPRHRRKGKNRPRGDRKSRESRVRPRRITIIARGDRPSSMARICRREIDGGQRGNDSDGGGGGGDARDGQVEGNSRETCCERVVRRSFGAGNFRSCRVRSSRDDRNFRLQTAPRR